MTVEVTDNVCDGAGTRRRSEGSGEKRGEKRGERRSRTSALKPERSQTRGCDRQSPLTLEKHRERTAGRQPETSFQQRT